MPNQIINTIRDGLLNNPRKPENLTRMQEIALSIREQGTNQKEGRVNPLTKKGLNALVSVLSTEDKIQGLSKSNSGSFSSRSQISRSQGSFSSRSQISRSQGSFSSRSRSRSRSQGSISSIQSVSLRDIESRNDAIIEKLNFMTVKILIAISSLAGNTLYLNNTIITSASFISIFQITLFIFFNCINKIESMRDNESMTEIDVGRILSINNDNNDNNDNNPDMIGGAGYDKKFLLKTINLLINAKSIRYRNAIIYLFACIFVFVLLKKYSEKYDDKINILGGKTKKPRMRRNA
jgi:hypothetical protein